MSLDDFDIPPKYEEPDELGDYEGYDDYSVQYFCELVKSGIITSDGGSGDLVYNYKILNEKSLSPGNLLVIIEFLKDVDIVKLEHIVVRWYSK